MRTGGTIVALALVFAFCVGLRSRWASLATKSQALWIALAVTGILSRSFTDALRWEFAVSRVNDALLWARIAGYMLLVVLFSRVRPRRFTIPAAAILLLPLFSATVYLPLQLVFDPTPRNLVHVSEDVVFEEIPWQRDGNDNRAVDYTVSRRSRWLPFLQRNFRAGRLYRTQCDIDAIRATLAAPDLVILFCPSGAPGEPPFVDDVPLRGTAKRVAAAVIGSKS